MNLLLLFLLQAAQNLTWGDVDVVWIEKDTPVTNMVIKFADGSMRSNNGALLGASKGLAWGTVLFSQKDLADFWELSHAKMSTAFSDYEFDLFLKGPTDDFRKIASKMCHILTNSTYPEDQMSKFVKRSKSTSERYLKDGNIYTAVSLFLEIAAKGTPFSYPSNGKLKDLSNYTPELLQNEMEYMVKIPKKTIYLLGPKSSLDIENVLLEDCGFTGNFVRKIPVEQTQVNNAGVYFLENPKLDKSTVIIGSISSGNELLSGIETNVASTFLNGAEEVAINRELSSKLGLTYPAIANVTNARQYGMNYFSGQSEKGATLDLINTFMQTIANLDLNEETLQMFDRAKKDLVYGVYKQQESEEKYLYFLSLFLDYYKLTLDNGVPDINELFNQVSEQKVIDYIKRVFDFSKVSIIVFGDRSVLEQLQTYFKDVSVLDPNDYLHVE